MLLASLVACGGADDPAKGTAGSGAIATGGNAGTGGNAATGGTGTGGSTSGLVSEIADACAADCMAQFTGGCPPKGMSEHDCELVCESATLSLGDFCLAEVRDFHRCRAAGGYDCVQDYATPRSMCDAENQAYAACAQDIGCKRYCAQVIALGCSDSELDTCVQSCITEDRAIPESCGVGTEAIESCQATSGGVCEGNGLSTPDTCVSTVQRVAACLGETDDCDGWCFTAQWLGCGAADCASTCSQKKSDPACGSAYDAVLQCEALFNAAECHGGTLSDNGSCQQQVATYQACIAVN